MDYPITRPVVQLYHPAASLRIRPRSAGNYVQCCNHVYAEAHGAALVMDVFAPKSGGNGLGIVDVVSGGWMSDRVRLNEHIGMGFFDVFCDAGYTVFAVSPGSVTKFCGLNMVRHIQEALRYIKTKAHEFNIDPERLGITGVSAGGHLAALTALRPKPSRPNTRDPFRQQNTRVAAMGFFFPPTDLVTHQDRLFDLREGDAPQRDRLLFQDGLAPHTPEEIHERLIALSPVHQVQDVTPPCLLIHGDADPIVPLSHSKQLAHALENAGGTVQLVVKPGGGHPWPTVRNEIEYMAQWFGRMLT